MSTANHFIIECRTNLTTREGDYISKHDRFTTNNSTRATSIFEDQCALHERVELSSYHVTADNREVPELVNIQFGGLS